MLLPVTAYGVAQQRTPEYGHALTTGTGENPAAKVRPLIRKSSVARPASSVAHGSNAGGHSTPRPGHPLIR